MKHLDLTKLKPGWAGKDSMREQAEDLLRGDFKLQSKPFSPWSVSNPENTKHQPFKKGGPVKAHAEIDVRIKERKNSHEKHGYRIPTDLGIPKERKYKKHAAAGINDYYREGGAVGGEDRGGQAYMKGPRKTRGVQHQEMFLGGLKKGFQNMWAKAKPTLQNAWNTAKPVLESTGKNAAKRLVEEGLKRAPGAIESVSNFAGKHAGDVGSKLFGESARGAASQMAKNKASELGHRALANYHDKLPFKKGGSRHPYRRDYSMRQVEKAHAAEGKLIGRMKGEKRGKKHFDEGGQMPGVTQQQMPNWQRDSNNAQINGQATPLSTGANAQQNVQSAPMSMSVMQKQMAVKKPTGMQQMIKPANVTGTRFDLSTRR